MPRPSPKSKPSRRRAPQRRLIDLALQGGGSHGAFTWGVLDRLLEDERLEIAGVSGTSAGAMNAVALASGLTEGGREGARETLRRFWRRVSEASPFHHLHTGPLGAALDPAHPWMAPLQFYAELVGRLFSPYQLNPFNLNPLRAILAETVDFERVRRCDKVRLFIAATHVRTGHLRIFRQPELDADVVMASACLPLLFQAVEIGGEPYWDGGFAGNPSLLPLITESPADDLVLVQINPSLREEAPTTARDILDRINEITFNASLLKEMRSIGLLKRLILDEGRPGHHYGNRAFQRIDALRVHRLDGDAQLADLGASTKTDTRWSFLTELHAIGREAADRWLARNFRHLGHRSTVDLLRDFAP